MENILFLLGAYVLIFIAVNAINKQRDDLKMTYLASLVRKSVHSRHVWHNIRLGVASMLMEGDSMRTASVIVGFANGRIINQAQTAQALVSAQITKCFWVWIACLLTLSVTNVDNFWVILALLGTALVLCNFSHTVNTTGYILIFTAVLLLGLLFAVGSVSTFAGSPFPFWNYTLFSDVVGVVLSGFAGVLVGTLVHGNLLCVFAVLPFITCGLVGVESAVAFVGGTEVGTLFPMSMMVSESTIRSRKAFVFLTFVVVISWVIDLVILSLFDLSYLTSAGVLGFAAAYTVFFFLIPLSVYFFSGIKIWTKVSEVTNENHADPKRHLHKFSAEYTPHVSILMLQTELEIVNLHFRIHKMLDFTIDLIDGDDSPASMEHIRKYRKIVIRTTDEITDFIISQTSMKNNVHISGYVKELLASVNIQYQLGNLFCDMAEAISRSDRSQYPIIRRCIVSLETLYNLSTKLIKSRFSSNAEKESILVADVDNLSRQLADLTGELSANPECEFLPYALNRSGKNILSIIDLLD